VSDNAKAVVLLVLLACIALPPIAWAFPDLLPESINDACRFGLPLLGLLALGVAAWALFRRDKAPNFLQRLGGDYFERDGFCFMLKLSVLGDICLINVHYQNKHNRPCQAKVALRPTQGGVFHAHEKSEKKMEQITIPVECEGGAYGVTSMPWGVPRDLQGKEITLEVAAVVRYPQGQGSLIRFGYGLRVGHADWVNWSGAGAGSSFAMTGKLMIMSPARETLAVPGGVLEVVPDDSPIVNQTLWRPGDPDDPQLHARVPLLSATM